MRVHGKLDKLPNTNSIAEYRIPKRKHFWAFQPICLMYCSVIQSHSNVLRRIYLPISANYKLFDGALCVHCINSRILTLKTLYFLQWHFGAANVLVKVALYIARNISTYIRLHFFVIQENFIFLSLNDINKKQMSFSLLV